MQNSKRLLAGVLLVLCAAPSVWGYTFLNITDRRDYAFDRNGILYITSNSGSVQRYNTNTSSFLTPFNIGGNPIGIDDRRGGIRRRSGMAAGRHGVRQLRNEAR